MYILGISAFYHDAAAALLKNGEIIAAAQEERFTRKKHDPSFPVNAIRFCLDYAGIELKDIETIVFYDKPLLKFERLLETYYAFAPKGIQSFVLSMPVWLKEKIFLKKSIRESLKTIGTWKEKEGSLLFPEHHLSHAASAYYPSPYEDAAILTIDGVGEWATASICHGKGNQIEILKQLDFPNSLGLLYSAFTYYCGFKVNSGEYKLMGLAPYGNPDAPEVHQYVKSIKEQMVDIKPDGSIQLNQKFFDYETGLRMAHDEEWEKLFGFGRRKSESNLEQEHCNLALAIQMVTEDIVLKMAAEAKRLTGSENLCMAGGVALNCVANGKIDDAHIFRNIFIQPAAGDAGGALGAAYAAHYIYHGNPRKPVSGELDAMKGSYLGTYYNEHDISKLLDRYNAPYEFIADDTALVEKAAELLASGNIIGWHQGRMEFGPRALGARSILADARNPDMQKKLNLKIKFREGFRPFAPIVLAEEVSAFFEHEGISPYMLLVKPVKKSHQIPYPEGFKGNSLLDKLYFKRSDMPSITHIDYSARLQTIHKETNPRVWNLLKAFQGKTGYPVLVNTSFNVRGEPIVNTPEDSYRCFMRTDMDYLIIGNFIVDKKQQPEWKDKDDWRTEFTLD